MKMSLGSIQVEVLCDLRAQMDTELKKSYCKQSPNNLASIEFGKANVQIPWMFGKS
jgi:hypothetical protein